MAKVVFASAKFATHSDKERQFICRWKVDFGAATLPPVFVLIVLFVWLVGWLVCFVVTVFGVVAFF